MAALYCMATGRPIPTVQWYKSGTAVTPIPSLFQLAFIVPTDTPHTTVYTCTGTNHAGKRKHVNHANITVTVESKYRIHSTFGSDSNMVVWRFWLQSPNLM